MSNLFHVHSLVSMAFHLFVSLAALRTDILVNCGFQDDIESNVFVRTTTAHNKANCTNIVQYMMKCSNYSLIPNKAIRLISMGIAGVELSAQSNKLYLQPVKLFFIVCG